MTAFVARLWAEHREPGNVVTQAIACGLVALGVVLLVAGVGAPIAGALALAGVLLRAAGPRVYRDVGRDHLGPPPGGWALHELATIFFGLPIFLLFARLHRGALPSLRRAIEARAADLFVPRERATWRNWAGTARCTPARLRYPRTPEEIAAIVAEARREGRKVRVVGAAYSWAPLVPTDDVLICLVRMNEVRLDLSRTGRPRAIVGAGATGRDLNRVIEPAGFALTSNVVMETVSWGGMIGVGAHGSGRDEGTLSDMVEVIELVDGTGALRRFEAGVDPDEVMRAARVALGLFGVVHRVTLRLVPAFRVRHEDRFVETERVLAELPARLAQNEYFDLYWMPWNERIWVRTWNRTDEPRTPRPPQGPLTGLSDRSHWGLWMSWIQTMGLLPLDGIATLAPRLRPAVCRMKMSLGREDTRVVHIHEATHFRSGIESYKVGCVEFAIPVDEAGENVRRAWDAIRRAIDAWAARGRYPLTMVVNARFIRSSDCLLSPAHGNERTCYIEILGDHRGPDWRAFAVEVARAWMALPNARPHWGKEYDFIPGIAEHVRAVLGDDLARFRRVREALAVDPDGIFVNPLIERLLLDGGRRASGQDAAA